ncbi:MAG TPA: acyltransferase [Polyangiaceae bacterium]|nr:acyltransferase [Polyangiaceae bacterium]
MMEVSADQKRSELATSGIEPPRQPRLRHVDQLDGLRGLAIVFVMLFHMNAVPPVGRAARLWSWLCGNGGLGVDIFFVLSGFLITGILLDALQRPHYFRNFYARRVLRIFPLYYAVLIFAFLILPQLVPWSVLRYEQVNREAIWYWLHLSNFSIARRGAFIHPIVDVSWSLAIEEQFYLLWPTVVWCVSVPRLRWLCIGLIALSFASRAWLTAVHVAPVAIYTLTFCRFDGLAIGALIALTVRDRLPSAIRALMLRGLLATSPLGLIILLPLDGPLANAVKVASVYLFVSALTGCVILTVLSTPNALLIRPLKWSVLRVFGRYSYALYLFHYPISGAIRDFVLKPSRMPLVFGSSLPAQALLYLVAGSISLGAALLSWHLYEKRFLRWKRFFA